MAIEGIIGGNADVNLHNADSTTGRKAESDSATINLSVEDIAVLDAIKIQTDKFVFTSTALDVNIASGSLSINLDNATDDILVYGWDGSANQKIKTDSAGELQVDILSSALPTGASTASNQATANGHLSSIAGEDFATQTTLAALRVDFNAEDFATQTTLNSLLIAFNAEDFASEITLGGIKTTTDQMTFTGSDLNVRIASGITVNVNLDNADDDVLVYGFDGASNQKITTDAQGHIQVDVLSSALPSGASTELKQDDVITQLTSIAGEDFATQTTLASVLAKIIAAPSTEAKQNDAITQLTSIAGEDFATQTTLASVLAFLNAEDFASETTLDGVKTQTDKLTFTSTSLDVNITGGTLFPEDDDDDSVAAGQTGLSLGLNLLYGFGGSTWERIGSTSNALDVNIKSGVTINVNLDNASDDVLVYGWDGSANQKIKTDASGELQVDVLSSALPSGAATSANQTTANSLLSTIAGDTTSLDAKFGSLGQKVMAGSTPVVIASDQSKLDFNIHDGSGTALTSTGASLNVNITGGSSSGPSDTDDGSIAGSQNVGLSTGLNYGWGGSAWERLNATSGSLDVNITGGSSSGPSDTDDGSIAGAQNVGLSTGLNYGWDGSAWERLNSTSNRLLVDGSGVTQPISASALPLPAGASTSANQATGNASLSIIAGDTTSLDTKITVETDDDAIAAPGTTAFHATIGLSYGFDGTNWERLQTNASGALDINDGGNSITVDDGGTTLSIDASSLPLPTGAATSANQTTANSSLSTIAGDTTSLDAKFGSLGQKAMAGSTPVVIASDQSNINFNVHDGTGTAITSTGTALDVNISSGASSGPTDTDDGSIAGAQNVGLSTGLNHGWDGAVWERLNSTSGSLDVNVTSSGGSGPGGSVDTNNSTAATLGASASFVGTGTDMLNEAMIVVNLHAEPAGATGTLFMEFSSDNVNWDRTITIIISDPTGQPPHSLIPVSQYFRCRYTNDGTPQTAMRLQTIVHNTKSKGLTSRADQTISDATDVDNVRALVVGRTAAGAYENVGVSVEGGKTLQFAISKPWSEHLVDASAVFSSTFTINALIAGADAILIRNPSGSGKIVHIVGIIVAPEYNTRVDAEIFANPTVSADGAALTLTNRRLQASPPTADVEVFSEPTISADGTLFESNTTKDSSTTIPAIAGAIALEETEMILVKIASEKDNKDVRLTIITAEE